MRPQTGTIAPRRPGRARRLASIIAATAMGSFTPARAEGPPAFPKATPRVTGQATPGSRVRLKAEGPAGVGSRYRWVQTDGPRAIVDRPDQPVAELTLPDGPGPLGFILVVANDAGIDAAAVTVPINRPGGAQASPPRADAGPDISGVAGKPLTLDGSKSGPVGSLGFRWFQLSGPEAPPSTPDAATTVVTPTHPGTYRFALVVSEGDRLSEPDMVDLTVSPPPPPTDSELAALAVAGLKIDSAAGAGLATAYDEVAGRAGLYESYYQAYSELSQRLESIVPREPDARSRWAGGLFAPLTARMVERMRAEGLDLLRPEGLTAPLNEPQRAALARFFHSVAEGVRGPRPPG